MATQVIVLNGGSTSGKSGLVRCLQAVLLPQPWLAFAVDGLIEAIPAALRSADAGIAFGADGEVEVGPAFRTLEEAWMAGVAATAAAGARVIIDDVFLGGASSQQRWEQPLTGLDVLWVGVHCDASVAAGRELARGDRSPGMAARQASIVHRGVHYDVEVDTTHSEALTCARTVAVHVG